MPRLLSAKGRKAAKRLLLFLLQTYVALLVALYVFQRSLLYVPSGNVPQEAIAGFTTIPLTADDSNATFAWYSPAPNSTAPTILFLHGNGGNLSMWRQTFHALGAQGFGVLALEYRGYGGSGGSPSEDGLYADARAALRYATGHEKIPENQLIVMGVSLGSGIAVQMADEFALGGVVLVSPYSSMVDAASNRYPFVPVSLLLKDRYDSIAKIPRMTEPLLVFHGTEDRLVPYAQGEKLFAAATSPKRFVKMDGQGHNNLDYDVIVKETARWIQALPVGQ